MQIRSTIFYDMEHMKCYSWGVQGDEICSSSIQGGFLWFHSYLVIVCTAIWFFKTPSWSLLRHLKNLMNRDSSLHWRRSHSLPFGFFLSCFFVLIMVSDLSDQYHFWFKQYFEAIRSSTFIFIQVLSYGCSSSSPYRQYWCCYSRQKMNGLWMGIDFLRFNYLIILFPWLQKLQENSYNSLFDLN